MAKHVSQHSAKKVETEASPEAQPSGKSGSGFFNTFTLLKGLVVLALVGFVVFTLASNPTSDAAIEDVAAASFAAMQEDAGTMQVEDNLAVRRYYNLNAGDFDGVWLAGPTSNMEVTELLIVKLADTAQASAVTAAIDERIAAQLNAFDGYGPDQVALLDASITTVRGNYVFFACGSQAQAAQKAFLDSL